MPAAPVALWVAFRPKVRPGIIRACGVPSRDEPVRALARAASVRPGEGRILALVALLFAALEAGRGFGEVGADTLAVGRFGPAILPYLFIGLGAVGMVASLAFGAALGRLPRTPLLVGIVVAASALLFAFLVGLLKDIERDKYFATNFYFRLKRTRAGFQPQRH